MVEIEIDPTQHSDTPHHRFTSCIALRCERIHVVETVDRKRRSKDTCASLRRVPMPPGPPRKAPTDFHM